VELIDLSPGSLAVAAVLVVALAVLSIRMRFGVEKQLLIAAARTVIQLSLIGFVLTWVFAHESPLWIGTMAVIMLLVAGSEVMRRQHRRFTGWWGYGIGTVSMFFSSFTVSTFALLFVVSVRPWYKPQYAIPLVGMILGNSMTGIALGLDRLTEAASKQRQVIEARLILGHPWHEAIGDIRRASIRSALMPIINSMSIIGLVHLPGMMTGQILAGSLPAKAVKYQIMIMFMIAAGTGFGSMAAILLGSRRLFDRRQRLRLERLRS
jgi:putative ABC transport system permease protein